MILTAETYIIECALLLATVVAALIFLMFAVRLKPNLQ